MKMMLKRFSLISSVILLMLSCQENKPDVVDGTCRLSVSVAGPLSTWEKGAGMETFIMDSKSVLHTTLKNSSSDAVKPVFSGALALSEGHYTIYGIYPLESYRSYFSGTRVKMSLPGRQSFSKAGPDSKADIMVSLPCEFDYKGGAASVSGNLERVSCIVKIVPSGFSSEKVQSATLEFQESMVAGEATVDFASRSVGSFVGKGDNQIILEASESFTMNGVSAVYAGVWPAVLKNGEKIILKLRTDKKVYNKTFVAGTDFPVSLEAGKTVEIKCPLKESDAVAAKELRMMSFNVKAGTDGDTAAHNWTSRKVGQKMMVEKWSPDIIAIQEADVAQRKFYAAIPGYSFVTVTNVPQSGADYKQSGLNEIAYRTSRFKLLDSGWYWLSETPDKVSKGYSYDGYLTAVYAQLEDNENGQNFYVVCTHLASGDNEASRRFTSKLVVDRTKELCGSNSVVFIMGDMNAADYTGSAVRGYPEKRESIAPFFEWLENARSTAAEKVGDYSLNHWGEWTKHATLNVDMIFYRNIKSSDCFSTDVNPYNNTEYISDHYPIIFDCKY